MATTPTTTGGNWFTKMSPEAQAALIQGGAAIGGGILGGIGENKRDEANRDFQYDQLASQNKNQSANRALEAAQSDPLAGQLARQRAALFASLLPGMRNVEVHSDIPGMDQFIPKITGGMRLPEGGISPEALAFSSPSAMANAEAQHWKQLGLPGPDLSLLGYGQAGSDAMAAAGRGAAPGVGNPAETAAIHQTLNGKPPKGYEYDKKTGQLKKKGDSIWKKIGKVAAIAAPIIAAPFTGGASLALIGAMSGAASGALNGGGWKGALMGAGMGAIPMGGAAGGAAGGATSAAGKIGQALTTPAAMMKLGGTAVGGKVGNALNLASGFAPGGSPFGPKAGSPAQAGMQNWVKNSQANASQVGQAYPGVAQQGAAMINPQFNVQDYLPGGRLATPAYTR